MPDTPIGVAYGEALSDLFYDAAPVKEFRKRYRLEKLPGTKFLLQAILKAYKEWGGKNKKPNIAILEFRQPFQTTESGESTLIAQLFTRKGIAWKWFRPISSNTATACLSRGDFPIELIFRRIKVQEFLVRFDLTHPLLRAYQDRAFCLVNSFRSELAQKKAMFELLTDEEITSRLPGGRAPRHPGIHSLDAPGAGLQDPVQEAAGGPARVHSAQSPEAGAASQRRRR